MQSNLQFGLSTLQIIIILTIVAFIIGLIATISGNNDVELAAQNAANTTTDETTLDNTPQNIAETQTSPVSPAENAQNEQTDRLEAEMEVNANATSDMAELAATSEAAPSPIAAETTPGTFETYSPEKLALANGGTVVLFFHADWCPSCRNLENDLTARLSEIPENIHILKLDYDTETELKRQYGVIRQHTLVVVDADGTELKKLTGLTNTLDQVVDQL